MCVHAGWCMEVGAWRLVHLYCICALVLCSWSMQTHRGWCNGAGHDSLPSGRESWLSGPTLFSVCGSVVSSMQFLVYGSMIIFYFSKTERECWLFAQKSEFFRDFLLSKKNIMLCFFLTI